MSLAGEKAYEKEEWSLKEKFQLIEIILLFTTIIFLAWQSIIARAQTDQLIRQNIIAEMPLLAPKNYSGVNRDFVNSGNGPALNPVIFLIKMESNTIKIERTDYNLFAIPPNDTVENIDNNRKETYSLNHEDFYKIFPKDEFKVEDRVSSTLLFHGIILYKSINKDCYASTFDEKGFEFEKEIGECDY